MAKSRSKKKSKKNKKTNQNKPKQNNAANKNQVAKSESSELNSIEIKDLKIIEATLDEKIKLIYKDYKYAWIHKYDDLQLIDLEHIDNIIIDDNNTDIDKKTINLSNLIELKLFDEYKEENIKLSLDMDNRQIWNKETETKIMLEEQQVISNNKINSSGMNREIQKNEGFYVLKLVHVLNYEKDGQAYIEETHLNGIEARTFTKELEG